MLDVGASTHNAGDDYPDFAYAVAQTIVTSQSKRGIVICGSGIVPVSLLTKYQELEHASATILIQLTGGGT